MLTLTAENYFTPEADQEYMSVSRFQTALECESQYLAIIKGEYKEEETETFLIGKYVHAWNEHTIGRFIIEHSEIFTQKGTLREKFQHADVMINTLEKDAFCMFMLQGQKEVILTAEWAGCWWKIRIDNYLPEEGRMVDLKTCKSVHDTEWDPKIRRRVSWIEYYGYVTRTAIYLEVERLAAGRSSWLSPYLVAISKEKPPDKAVISMLHDDWDFNRMVDELQIVQSRLPRILQVRAGEIEPNRCEKCPYCRQTKVLAGEVIPWRDL